MIYTVPVHLIINYPPTIYIVIKPMIRVKIDLIMQVDTKMYVLILKKFDRIKRMHNS